MNSISPPYNFRRSTSLILSALMVFHIAVPAGAQPVPIRLFSVTLFQDVHGHAEAQKSLEAALAGLTAHAPGSVRVGIEGAAGALRFEPYRAFPDVRLTATVARSLMDQDLISGPLLAGLLHNRLRLCGLEDPAAYAANVEAYRQAVADQKNIIARIQRDEGRLAREKARRFSGPLRAFDRSRDEYRAGRMTLSNYLSVLLPLLDEPALPLETFAAARRMENEIDFARLEDDMRRVLEAVASRLRESESLRIQAQLSMTTKGPDDAAERLAFLIQLARAKNAPNSAVQKLDTYHQYLRLARSLDPDRLFSELRRAEAELESKWGGRDATTASLLRQSNALHLSTRLSRFELTPAEWADCSALKLSNPALRPFLKFYELADARSRVMADAIVRDRLAAAVVGGFHTPELTALLKKVGIAVAVVRPTLSRVDPSDGSSYLTVFARKKTPLERLFSRDSLFLAPPAGFGTKRIIPVDQPDPNAVFVASYLTRVDKRFYTQARFAARALLSRTWFWETAATSGVMMVGWALDNAALIAGGTLLSLVAPVLMHPQDWQLSASKRLRAFQNRLAWSSLFTFAYLVPVAGVRCVCGPLAWPSVLLPLLLPVALHYRNQRNFTNPNSWAARLFSRAGFANLAMNVDPQTQYALVMERVKKEYLEALHQWVEARRRSSPSFVDPVSALMDRYANEAVESGSHDLGLAMTNGLLAAIGDCSLTKEELRIRFETDVKANVERGLRFTTHNARLINRNLLGNMLAVLQNERKGPLAEAAIEGYVNAMTDEVARRALDAVRDWRARRDPATLHGGDEGLVSLYNIIQFEMVENNTHRYVLFSKPIVEALALSALTPKEAEVRIRNDLSLPDSGTQFIFLRRMYGLYGEHSGLPDAVREATHKTYTEASRFVVSRDMDLAIAQWRLGVTARINYEKDHDPVEIVYRRIGEAVSGSDTDLIDVVADRLLAAQLTPQELEQRAVRDRLYSLFIWLKWDFNPALSDFVCAVFNRLEEKLGRDTERGQLIRVNMGESNEQAVASILEQTLVAWVEDLENRAPTNDADAFIDMLKRFLSQTQQLHIKPELIAKGAARGLVAANLSLENAVTVMKQSFHVAVSDFVKTKTDIELFGHVYDIFSSYVDALDEARSPLLAEQLRREYDPRSFYEESLAVWKDHAREPEATHQMESAVFRIPLIDALHRTVGAPTPLDFDLSQPILKAGLSKDQLRERAKADVSILLELRENGPIPIEYMVYGAAGPLDPILNYVVDSWMAAASELAPSDHEKARAIVVGVSESLVQPYKTGREIGTALQHYVLPYMIAVAKKAKSLNCPHEALSLASTAVNWSSPGRESVETARDVYDLIGWAQFQLNEPVKALKSGLEPGASIAWAQLSRGTKSLAERASFLNRAADLVSLCFKVGLHTQAAQYLRFFDGLLERTTLLTAALTPHLEMSMKGVRAAVGVQAGTDKTAWPAHVDALKEVVRYSESPDSPLHGEEAYWRSILLERLARACALGEKTYFNQAVDECSRLYADPSHRLSRAAKLARIHRLFARALETRFGRNEDVEFHQEEAGRILRAAGVPQLMVSTLADAQAKLAYAQHLIWRAEHRDADNVLQTLQFFMERQLKANAGKVDVVLYDQLIYRSVLMQRLDLALLTKAPVSKAAELVKLMLPDPLSNPRLIAEVPNIAERFAPDEAYAAAVQGLLLDRTRIELTPLQLYWFFIFMEKLQVRGIEVQERALLGKKGEGPLLRLAKEYLSPPPSEWPAVLHMGPKVDDLIRMFDLRLQTLLKTSTLTGPGLMTQFNISLRSDMMSMAGLYAAKGFPSFATDLHRLARQATDRVAKKANVNMSQVGERRVRIDLPMMGGSSKLAVAEGVRALKDASDLSSSSDYAEASTFLFAATGLFSESWSTLKELEQSLQEAARILDRIKNPALLPLVMVVRAHFKLMLGQPDEAANFLMEAIKFSTVDQWESRRHGAGATIELLPFVLLNPALPLSRRVDMVRDYLTGLKDNPDHNPVALEYWSLTVESIAASSPAAREALALRWAEFVNRNIHANLADYIEAGMNFFLLHALLDLDPASPARKGLETAMGKVRLWSGARADGFHAIVDAVLDARAGGPSIASWYHAHPQPNLLPYETAVWALVESVEKRDWTSAERMMEKLFEVPVYYTEGRAVHEVARTLMVLPRGRAAFLAAFENALSATPPADWKDRKGLFKKVATTAATLGAPEILYEFDRLAGDKSFPWRDILTGPKGLIAQMETGLTEDQWIDRLVHLSPERAQQMEALAKKHISEAVWPRLASMLEEKRNELHRLNDAEQKMTAAEDAAQRFEFGAAHAELNSVPPAYRNDRWSMLSARMGDLSRAWEAFQRHEDPAALEILDSETLRADPLSQSLKFYITQIQRLEAASTAAAMGPEDIRADLQNLNHLGSDARATKLDHDALSVITSASTLFEAVKDALTQFEMHLRKALDDKGTRRSFHPEALERLDAQWLQTIEGFRRVLQLNGNFSEAAHFCLSQGETLLAAGKEDLLHRRFGLTRGRFQHAEDLIYTAYELSRIQAVKDKALALREDLRPWHVFHDVTVHLRMLKTKMEADEFKAEKVLEVGEDTAVSAKLSVLYFGSDWVYDTDKGRFYVPLVNLMRPGTFSHGRSEFSSGAVVRSWSMHRGNLAEAVESVLAAAPSAYQMTWDPIREGPRVTIGMTFLGLDKDGKGLMFEIDKQNGQKLLNAKGQMVHGRMRWMEDYSTLAQISILEPIENRLRLALTRGQSTATTGSEIIDRLLGLNIKMDSFAPENRVFFNEKLQSDPFQTRMIQDMTSPSAKAGLVWGPPGSGKTTTMEEIARQVNQPMPGRPGEIVVVVSQSNFGLDNVGKKLKRSDVPFVRAAAQDTSVDEALKDEHANRMPNLMSRIEAHHSRGQGFVYLATNNGLIFDRKLYALLKMYLDGAPMSEIRSQYQYWMRAFSKGGNARARNGGSQRSLSADDYSRQSIEPLLAQEEGSLATLAESLLPVVHLNPKRYLVIGDHQQLPAHGLGDEAAREVQLQVQKGFRPSLGAPNDIYGDEAIRNEQTSLFERAFGYAKRWAGLLNYFLQTVRRSHWGITTVFNVLFYDGRLIHRDRHKPDSEWEPLAPDTILVVDLDKRGQRQAHEEPSGRDAVSGSSDGGASWRNFAEAGEVVRLVQYYLNHGYSPQEIFILTPYRAQNELIHQLLRATAILNDFATAKDIRPDDLGEALQILNSHLEIRRRRDSGKPHSAQLQIDRLKLEITRLTATSDPAHQVKVVMQLLKPIYNIQFAGPRLLSLDDVKKISEARAPVDRSDIGKLAPKTIDSIQGQENKVVIISFTRSNFGRGIGFLKLSTGLKRLNVALSRAEDKLALVGSFSTLIEGGRDSAGKSIYKMLVDTVAQLYKSYNDRQSDSKRKVAWSILSESPSSANLPFNGGHKASLLQAWGLTDGSTVWDRFVMPVVETAFFLGTLSMGLAHHEGILIFLGVILKSFVFPAFHWAPSRLGLSPVRRFQSEWMAANGILASYLFSVAVGWTLGWPLEALSHQMLAVPALLHTLWNNKDVLASLTDWTDPVQSQEVGSLNGLADVRTQRWAELWLRTTPDITLEMKPRAVRRRVLSQV